MVRILDMSWLIILYLSFAIFIFSKKKMRLLHHTCIILLGAYLFFYLYASTEWYKSDLYLLPTQVALSGLLLCVFLYSTLCIRGDKFYVIVCIIYGGIFLSSIHFLERWMAVSDILESLSDIISELVVISGTFLKNLLSNDFVSALSVMVVGDLLASIIKRRLFCK